MDHLPRCAKMERSWGSGRKRASRKALCHSNESEKNANVSPVPLIALQLRVRGSKEPIPVERLWKDSTWCVCFNSDHIVTRGRLENLRKVQAKSSKNEQTGESVYWKKNDGPWQACLPWKSYSLGCMQRHAAARPHKQGAQAPILHLFEGVAVPAWCQWCCLGEREDRRLLLASAPHREQTALGWSG